MKQLSKNRVVTYKGIAFTFNPCISYVEFSNGDMLSAPNGYNSTVKNKCLKHIDEICKQENEKMVALYLN
jgi:hypothetical protein